MQNQNSSKDEQLFIKNKNPTLWKGKIIFVVMFFAKKYNLFSHKEYLDFSWVGSSVFQMCS